MSVGKALVSGLLGAAAVSLLNETVRRAAPQAAPRMEILGMRAAKAGFEAAGAEVPPRRDLIKMTFAAEIATNSAYYSMVALGRPEHGLLTGTMLGLAAGVGAVMLPGPMGLGESPSARRPETMAMSVAWYTLGGVAAGAAWQAFGRDGENRN